MALTHDWPQDDGHVWSEWHSDKGMPKPTQYRMCVHPDCNAVEHREVPKV